MALSNKTLLDLKTSVKTWLNRDDPEVISAIPQFIELAEQEFSRVVKIPMEEGSYIKLIEPNDDLVTIPDDMLSPIGVWVSYNGLDPVSYTRIDGYAMFDKMRKKDDVDGHYFAKYQNQFLFYPTLNNGDIVDITYHKDLTPMNADDSTSPALKYGYDLMLYWSLKHASVFLRDPEQEQYWTSKAEEALYTMQQTFDEMHWAGSPLVVLNT